MGENAFTVFAGARRSVAMLLVVALLGLATAAHAEAPASARAGPPAAADTGPAWAGASQEDLGKLMTYAGCAVSIAIASTTAQIYIAVFGCVRIFIDEVDW